MQQRAADQEETRRRIVEATVELHGTVGPKNTTISAVAEKAGVQRLTVYRHFPDDVALFHACSSHWLGQNPPPDPAAWQAEDDVHARTRLALEALYAYFAGRSAMWSLVYRDLDEVGALRAPMAQFQGYLDSIRDDLVQAWHPAGRKPADLKATVGHALAFGTWRSLASAGLSAKQAAALACAWIEAVAGR